MFRSRAFIDHDHRPWCTATFDWTDKKSLGFLLLRFANTPPEIRIINRHCIDVFYKWVSHQQDESNWFESSKLRSELWTPAKNWFTFQKVQTRVFPPEKNFYKRIWTKFSYKIRSIRRETMIVTSEWRYVSWCFSLFEEGRIERHVNSAFFRTGSTTFSKFHRSKFFLNLIISEIYMFLEFVWGLRYFFRTGVTIFHIIGIFILCQHLPWFKNVSNWFHCSIRLWLEVLFIKISVNWSW